ncbi:hypothetical protein [Janibacter sp. GXQ6167]|uniref:TRAFAC clade GTPase domain-containing protein n=1 Tax=Janibacter sp. GXQ6167 TaxID=3240791 RepID=UPI003525F791
MSTYCPCCAKAISSAGPCVNCAFDVPSEWLDDVQVSLAMTGARTAGKTVLIAAMMYQFEEFLARHHRSFLTGLGDTAERFRDDYETPLFELRQLLPPTPRAEQANLKPLMWTFSVGGQKCCLSLVDAAGEDFETLRADDPRFAYLGHADLIVALIDPLKVAGVGAVLAGIANAPQGSGRDIEVLRRVLRARNAHRSQAKTEQYLALTLSKFDVLQQMRDLPAAPWQSIMNRPGSAMQRDRSFGTAYDDTVDGDLLNAELNGLLQAMGAEMLLAAAEEAQIPYRLFATSALGLPPTHDAVHKGGICSYRVLDPLKAALSMKIDASRTEKEWTA